MKAINESPITTLQIIKPDIVKKYYEMKSGEELFGTLDLVNNTGTLSRIITKQDTFSVKRSGFFRPYITVRNEKTNTDEAVAYLQIDSSTVITINNNTYCFRMVNVWKNQWGWTNDKNQILIRYKPTVAGTIRGDIEVSKDFLFDAFLETISMLGIYFLTQLEDEILKNNEMIFSK
ncbi:MAG: hypothetical protein LBU51_03545 [Bacteroidales bacterium]|jgi:hypothetical protein|nr:hypothetical protein [Bacteroidales bacterium]